MKLRTIAPIALAAFVLTLGGSMHRGVHAISLFHPLDIIAQTYLPSHSKANGWERCATTFQMLIHEHGPMVSERTLIDRAKELQLMLNPSELNAGVTIDESQCRTDGCDGWVDLRELMRSAYEIRPING